MVRVNIRYTGTSIYLHMFDFIFVSFDGSYGFGGWGTIERQVRCE